MEAANDFDFFSEYAMNDDAVNDGLLVEFRPGIKFRIAMINNRNFKMEAAKAYSKLDKKLDDMEDKEAADTMRNIAIEVLSRATLLGWEGPVKYKGKLLEYSQENAVKLLELETFRDWVESVASDRKRYKFVQLEAEAEKK